MTEPKYRDVLLDPVFNRNPIGLLVLGICSALAVTSKLENAVVMGVCVCVVAGFANMAVSVIRHHIPSIIRIAIQIVIIATLVILVEQILQAFFFDLARELSVFVGLIITNCIILGRAEGFAMKNGPVASFLDGVGNGLGYTVILLAVAFVRELFGAGTIFGIEVLRPTTSGGWYVTNGLAVLPPSAFFIIGGLIWALRVWKTDQVEEA